MIICISKMTLSQFFDEIKDKSTIYYAGSSSDVVMEYGIYNKKSSLFIVMHICGRQSMFKQVYQLTHKRGFCELYFVKYVDVNYGHNTLIYSGKSSYKTISGYTMYKHFLKYQQGKIYKFNGFQDISIITE
jgi:hypothetical protein